MMLPATSVSAGTPDTSNAEVEKLRGECTQLGAMAVAAIVVAALCACLVSASELHAVGAEAREREATTLLRAALSLGERAADVAEQASGQRDAARRVAEDAFGFASCSCKPRGCTPALHVGPAQVIRGRVPKAPLNEGAFVGVAR